MCLRVAFDLAEIEKTVGYLDASNPVDAFGWEIVRQVEIRYIVKIYH